MIYTLSLVCLGFLSHLGYSQRIPLGSSYVVILSILFSLIANSVHCTYLFLPIWPLPSLI